MTMTEHRPGTPCWVDLAAPDLDATAHFYTTLFGWTAHTSPEPEAGGYTIFQLGDVPVAAAGPLLNPEQPPAWTWYAATTDADATARSVQEAGGSVLVAPFDVLDAGRMAVFLDPAGAAFSAWQPGAMRGAGVLHEPGALRWVELMTRSPEAAREFYPRVFGWEVSESEGPQAYTRWGMAGEQFGGMMAMVGDQWPADLPDHWMVYFQVADIDATCATLKELGGNVSVGPFDAGDVGRVAIVGDNAGAFFSLIQPV
jgi:uncharacterized protein